MRTRPWMIALAGVFAVSAAHAQTAPTPAPVAAKPAPTAPPPPAKDDVHQGMRLGANIGDLVKAAVAQQQARAAAQASAGRDGAAAATTQAAAPADTKVAVAPQGAEAPPIP